MAIFYYANNLSLRTLLLVLSSPPIAKISRYFLTDLAQSKITNQENIYISINPIIVSLKLKISYTHVKLYLRVLQACHTANLVLVTLG